MIKQLLTALKSAPPGPVFNPWWQQDPMVDKGPDADAVRRTQLCAYLRPRLERCTLLLVAEALGYQGGRFTGIPMTSERQLLQSTEEHGFCQQIIPNVTPRRTSCIDLKPHGFTEPTATIVWRTLQQMGDIHQRTVLWNLFPWHPYDPVRGALSNRPLTAAERQAGLPIIDLLRKHLQPEIVVAVGRTADEALSQQKIEHRKVRHPSHGGAKLFSRQMFALSHRKD